MNKSEQINELATALALAQSKFPTVTKDANNPFFRSKYADLAALIEAIQPHMGSNGLSVVQLASTDVEQKLVVITTMLMHKSGQWISEEFKMPTPDWKAQGLGSATTYCRRYSLQSMLNLGAADDDGEAAQNRGGQGKAENEFSPKALTATQQKNKEIALAMGRGEKPAEKMQFPAKIPTPVLLDAKQRQMFWADAKKVTDDEELIRKVVKEVTGQDTTKGVHVHQTGAILNRLRELSAKQRGEVNPFDEEVAP
jgi:hypothetical protein